MAEYLHVRFEDGTEICVSSTEADFYIEKVAADGITVTGATVCQGCPITDGIDLAAEMGILDFNRSVVDAKLARLEWAVRP